MLGMVRTYYSQGVELTSRDGISALSGRTCEVYNPYRDVCIDDEAAPRTSRRQKYKHLAPRLHRLFRFTFSKHLY